MSQVQERHSLLANWRYVLVDGTVVANDWTALTRDTLLHAIDQTALHWNRQQCSRSTAVTGQNG